MEIGLIVVVALMALVILALVVTRARGRQLDPARLDERLDSLNQRLGEVTGQASTYQETLNAVNKALGGLTQTSQRLMDVGQDMQKLQELLASPTLRGAVGELMLEELLRQTLPEGFYSTQHTFRNGRRVDAVIRLKDGLVPQSDLLADRAEVQHGLGDSTVHVENDGLTWGHGGLSVHAFRHGSAQSVSLT